MADKIQAGTLKCVVCPKSENLKLLACLHLGCHACLKDLEKRKALSTELLINCPDCGANQNLGEDGVNGLPGIEFPKIQSQESVYQNLRLCTMCKAIGENEYSSHYCKNCKDNLCKTCTKRHLATKATKFHEVEALQDGESGDVPQTPTTTGEIPSCTKHSKNGEVLKLNIHCLQCNQAVCLKCQLEDHKSHETKDLLTMIQEGKEEFMGKIAFMRNKSSELLERMSQLDNLENAKKEQLDHSKNQAQELKNMLNKCIDEIFEKNIEGLTTSTNKEIEVLDQLKNKHGKEQSSLHKALCFGTAYAERNPAPFAKHMQYVAKGLAKYCENQNAVIIETRQMTVKTLSEKEVRDLLAPLKNLTEEKDAQVIHKVSEIELDFYPNKMAYLDDNILVDDKYNVWLIQGKDHQRKTKFAVDLGLIFDLAVHDKTVFVAHVKKQQSRVTAFTEDGSKKTSFILPKAENEKSNHKSYRLSIATNATGILYICSLMTGTVYKSSPEYTEAEPYISPTSPLHLKQPYTMCVTQMQELLVTSIQHAEFCIYKNNHDLPTKYDTKDWEKKPLLTGIVFDSMGNLLGCDFRNNKLYLINLTREPHAIQIHVDGLQGPNAIAYNQGTVAVANQQKKCIQLCRIIMDPYRV